MIELDWYKCYGEGWTGEIIPEAFQHPAKFSRKLIKRIYEHCIEQGWLTEGSKIVDPFGGVGLGGYHALQNGMHWLGVELEPVFVRLGSGYDCPGFTQADWTVRQQMDEPDQKNFVAHLCPTCQKTIAGEKVMGLLLEQTPHRFEGNIDLWERRYGGHFRKWGTARLVQGDSRKLREVVGRAVDGVLSSPPYAGLPVNDNQRFSRTERDKEAMNGPTPYGQSPGQLTQMPLGDADAVISSPPYSESLQGKTQTIDSSRLKRLEQAGYTEKHQHGFLRSKESQSQSGNYSDNPSNLGNLPTGDADAIITSSPYLGTVGSDDPDKRGGLYRDPKRRGDVSLTATYGESKGQLAGMEEGEIDTVLTSPPYAECLDNPSNKVETTGAGGPIHPRNYGKSDGQLAAMPAGEVTLDGLAALSPNAPEAIKVLEWKRRQAGDRDTFWSAARIIISECFAILKSGGVAIFVVKSFVRKGKIVDFPGQWQRLCESVGFETIEFIRAWLIEDRANAVALFDFDAEVAGEKVTVKTGDQLRASRKELKPPQLKRASFFRLLAEKKGSPRIDFEVVLVMQKPLERIEPQP